MRLTRTALLFGALLPVTLAFQPRGTSLAFTPEEGLSLTKTFEQQYVMTLDDVAVSIMGEQLELDGVPENVIESGETIVFVDDYEGVADGRATRLVRTFETLERTRRDTSPEGENETGESSELESLAVVFTWSDDHEEYGAAFADEESDADEDLLEGLWYDADLTGFLPDGEVEEGDSWEIDYEVWRQLNEPSGDLTFLDEDGESTFDEVDELLRENIEADIEVTFEGVREADGERVAVLTIEVETETEATVEEDLTEAFREDGAEIDSATQSRTISIVNESEGELLWLIEEGRFLSYEGTGSAEIEMTMTLMIEGDGEPFVQEQTLVFLGELEVLVSFE